MKLQFHGVRWFAGGNFLYFRRSVGRTRGTNCCDSTSHFRTAAVRLLKNFKQFKNFKNQSWAISSNEQETCRWRPGQIHTPGLSRLVFLSGDERFDSISSTGPQPSTYSRLMVMGSGNCCRTLEIGYTARPYPGRVGGVAPLGRMKLHWVKILGSNDRDGKGFLI